MGGRRDAEKEWEMKGGVEENPSEKELLLWMDEKIHGGRGGLKQGEAGQTKQGRRME